MTKSVTANTSWFIVHIWIQKNIKFLLVVKRNKNIIIFLSKFPGPLCAYCGEFWETVTVIEICRKHCDLEGQGTMKWFHNKIEQNWRQLMWQSCVAWSERLWNNNHPWFGRSWLTGVCFFRMAYCFPKSMGGANPENKWSKQVDTGPQYLRTGPRPSHKHFRFKSHLIPSYILTMWSQPQPTHLQGQGRHHVLRRKGCLCSVKRLSM